MLAKFKNVRKEFFDNSNKNRNKIYPFFRKNFSSLYLTWFNTGLAIN